MGGWFVALPLTSGRTVMIFAIERGTAFAADACVGGLLGLMSLNGPETKAHLQVRLQKKAGSQW